MTLKPPENETTRIDPPGRLELSDYQTLTTQLEEIKSTAPAVWTSEGWRLLNEYTRTRKAKHLFACKRHIEAIQARLTRLSNML